MRLPLAERVVPIQARHERNVTAHPLQRADHRRRLSRNCRRYLDNGHWRTGRCRDRENDCRWLKEDRRCGVDDCRRDAHDGSRRRFNLRRFEENARQDADKCRRLIDDLQWPNV